MARQHHDYQREGNTVGYYVPGSDPKTNSGNTLILAHKNVHVPAISDKMLLDDVIYEVDWDGDIVWEWKVSDHFEELGFDAIARNLMYRDPNYYTGSGTATSRATGCTPTPCPCSARTMVRRWRQALPPRQYHHRLPRRQHHPDHRKGHRQHRMEDRPVFRSDPRTAQARLDHRPAPRPHDPRGLPGEGNILIYDNGGWAGYYAPNPGSPTGIRGALRDYSRVLEIDPVTLEIVWQMTPKEAGYLMPLDANRFYSPFISGMQRLPNGNTMITEGPTAASSR